MRESNPRHKKELNSWKAASGREAACYRFSEWRKRAAWARAVSLH